MAGSLQATCHCGRVSVTIVRRPDYINHCNCTLCRKSGIIVGYFDKAEIKIEGETQYYTRENYPDPAVRLHFCETCSSVTHWSLTPAFEAKPKYTGQRGVNMRLFAPDTMTGVELRYPDGLNWTGETDFTYRRESEIISDKTNW